MTGMWSHLPTESIFAAEVSTITSTVVLSRRPNGVFRLDFDPLDVQALIVRNDNISQISRVH